MTPGKLKTRRILLLVAEQRGEVAEEFAQIRIVDGRGLEGANVARQGVLGPGLRIPHGAEMDDELLAELGRALVKQELAHAMLPVLDRRQHADQGGHVLGLSGALVVEQTRKHRGIQAGAGRCLRFGHFGDGQGGLVCSREAGHGATVFRILPY